ncbi:MAG: hypothetical protein J0I41_04050 [Filimonas sp.]|nr:hypothetical protein [Filimonas sp.]
MNLKTANTKNRKPVIIGLLIAVVCIVSFAMFIAVPKAAKLTMPYRWGNVPLGQKRFLFHNYYGKPLNGDSASLTDKWRANRENGFYTLEVNYGQDSSAQHYKILFTYKVGFIKKEYNLMEQ